MLGARKTLQKSSQTESWTSPSSGWSYYNTGVTPAQNGKGAFVLSYGAMAALDIFSCAFPSHSACWNASLISFSGKTWETTL